MSSATGFDREGDTMVPCPPCDGKGSLIIERTERLDGSYCVRGRTCDLCGGAGAVSPTRIRAWKLANFIDGSDR